MRLLIAEDDAALRARLKQALAQAGFAVDATGDGVEAEHLGDEPGYDAVVLDLGLPGRPGLEVLDNWRRRGNRVPVIVLTARGAWHEKVDGFRAGADDYLAKPFHMEELIARIGAIVRRRHDRAGGALSVGDLTLDEERQSVRRGALEIALSGTEFRLLRYLMLRPGRIVSKSELTEHVYDADSDKDSNVIEVYIKRLRDKLGPEWIQTRRGQGYVLHGPV